MTTVPFGPLDQVIFVHCQPHPESTLFSVHTLYNVVFCVAGIFLQLQLCCIPSVLYQPIHSISNAAVVFQKVFCISFPVLNPYICNAAFMIHLCNGASVALPATTCWMCFPPSIQLSFIASILCHLLEYCRIHDFNASHAA